MNEEVTTTMENVSCSCGYLELIVGPMYSGKTSKLFNIHKQYTFCEVKTLVINYEEDTRYSQTMLSTHDKSMIPCIKSTTLEGISDIANGNLTNEFSDASVILINEGQFFKDIVSWVSMAVEVYKKKVYICGLDGDFQRRKFGNWLDLIPLCDKVSKLHSFCSICKSKPAIFSHRISKVKTQKLIGSSCYVPLCRTCYNIENDTTHKCYIKTI
jgi:thymidine kinase